MLKRDALDFATKFQSHLGVETSEIISRLKIFSKEEHFAHVVQCQKFNGETFWASIATTKLEVAKTNLFQSVFHVIEKPTEEKMKLITQQFLSQLNQEEQSQVSQVSHVSHVEFGDSSSESDREQSTFTNEFLESKNDLQIYIEEQEKTHLNQDLNDLLVCDLDFMSEKIDISIHDLKNQISDLQNRKDVLVQYRKRLDIIKDLKKQYIDIEKRIHKYKLEIEDSQLKKKILEEKISKKV
ncbi:hypothetical protein M0811_11161 [Anaeramoeba ignava]|uniref:Uncharacterized protein n=1 Tax=Anaeramoeba ignava TaxID=1746090 RepID=A0A9Q0LC30_ANAIG|nr:hypothetical protein M0811_11161 [Anaeramoeba ignava]